MTQRLARKGRGIRRRPLLVTLIVASAGIVTFALSSASASTSSCSSSSTLQKSAFEIDGGTDGANLIVNTSGCIDWLAGGTGSNFRTGVSAKNDKPTGSSDDSFGQGTAEDNPNPTIVTGSIPPNKSDLKAFGAYAETGQADSGGPNPSGKFLELFWSRVQNPSGTTNMDFELNKEFCDGTADHCANNGTKTPLYVTPKRTAGDKLITYDLSKGGTVPTISIRTWSGTAWGPATVISTGGATATALGSVNTSTIPSNQTGGTSGGLTASLGQQDPYTFGEASIAYSAIFSGNTCGTFGSAYLKSRSSDSFTAEIKDFVEPEPVQISNCTSLVTSAAETVTIGAKIHDTATLGGATADATGTIAFKLYGPFTASDASTDACDAGHLLTTISTTQGDWTYNAGTGDWTVSVDSTPTAVGRYRWVATYTSGDANNVNAGPTACLDAAELDTVNKAQPSISTTLSATSITVGGSAHDSATLSNATSGAGGTVSYRVYSDLSVCNADTNPPTGGTNAGDKTVTGGSVPDSNNVTFNAAGTFYWRAFYSGDSNNEKASSACADETLVVGKKQPSISTTLSDTSIKVGGSAHDSATLSNATSGAGGTVSYRVYSDLAVCNADTNPPTAGTNAGDKTVTNGSVPDSNNVTFNTVGTFYWRAFYSGDSNNEKASSVCADETLVVGKLNSTIATGQKWYPQDEATVTGENSTSASGTVTFSLYKNDSTCGGTNENARVYGPDEQTLDGNGKAKTNQSTFSVSSVTSGDTYYWNAVYSGDTTHKAVTSCTEATTFTSLNNGSPVTSP